MEVPKLPGKLNLPRHAAPHGGALPFIRCQVVSSLALPRWFRALHSRVVSRLPLARSFETSTPKVTSKLPLPKRLRDFHSQSRFETPTPSVTSQPRPARPRTCNAPPRRNPNT